MTALLELRELRCSYPVGGARAFASRPALPVVHGVSFALREGETLALVGESGSGKTTIARAIAGLIAPSGGEIVFRGSPLPPTADRRDRELRRRIQFVFQNPDTSLNPRRRVASILGRPLRFFFGLRGRARLHRVEELLAAVHLDPAYARRFPAQLSGGERQRIAIAQALAAEPDVILCDEVVSALDVSVQAAVLDLLRELQAERGVSYLFITHDLAVVRWLAHRVLVLYRGHAVEEGPTTEVFAPPVHPYTEALLRAVPDPANRGHPLAPPAAPAGAGPGAGCPYVAECARALGSTCRDVAPPWRRPSSAHAFRCHIEPVELAAEQRPALLALTSPSGGRPAASGGGS